jgi:vanadium chloroperoxidase
MDPILYWNAVALEANRVSHTNGMKEQTGPTLSSRALGIVHLAMYDAFAGVANVAAPGTLAPYLPGLPGPVAGASADAAVAAAAHATLHQLFPSQRAFFDRKHGEAGLSGGGLDAGHEFGLVVAQRLLADRKDDPDASDRGHAVSMSVGSHRPDPDNPDQGYHAPFYGAKSKCFAVTARHGLLPPPRPGDPRYLAALREVRGKGIAPELMGTLPAGITRRIVDETLIGVYWGYDGSADLGTPPRLYNQIVRRIAEARANTPAQNARLFALVNVAMADAGILAWDQKYIHNLWRPVVGIREHDASMGPAGSGNNNINNDCDPGWLPLGAPASNSLKADAAGASAHYPCGHTVTSMSKNFTPPFPAYPSGHATFGAAALHITRLFYGVTANGPDTLFNGLTFVSDEHNGVTKDNKGAVRPRHVRNFPEGLWQMIIENGRSRVFLGVHWVFDAFAVNNANNPDVNQNIGGVPLGLEIARDIFNSGMNKSPVGPRP